MKSQLTDILTRGIHDITVRKKLESKLASGKKLRIKHGVDPTTNDLHLGYAVVYRKLRAFQKLGHTIIFLIGNFTARFGDPSDKDKTRTMRSKHDVELAATNYIDQLGRMLDIKKVEIRRNGEWYDAMSAERLLQLMSEFTLQQMLERDMFQKRIKQGKPIGLHEPVYPVLQAWDSFQIKSDVTVIGSDQTFNELQARIIQERHWQEPQDVMSMKLLVGTDGVQKMSQSLGNDISFSDNPENMYGKIMSLPDTALGEYFELLTDVPLDEIAKIIADKQNAMENKKRLASLIVEEFHNDEAAKRAQKHFENVIQRKEEPKEIQEVTSNSKILADAVADLFQISKSESKRLIEQGAISMNKQVLKDPYAKSKEGVYKKGKRDFRRLKKKK